MRRRFLSVLLAFSIIVMSVFLNGCQWGQEPADKAGYVTRGEWITMLAEKFNLNQYSADDPYYSDITSENPLFPYVQSLAEWDVLSVYSKDTLNPDKLVTYDEVASTAAIAAGFRANENGEYSVKESINYAVTHAIVNEEKSNYLTHEECSAIAQKAYNVYLNDPGEEKAVAVPNKDTVDLSGISPNEISVEGNEVTVRSGKVERSSDGTVTAVINSGNGSVEISAGDTFIAPASPEYPWGIAYKVTDIQESNGAILFTTESPTLEDLYEELDIHTSLPADLGGIVWDDGVSVSPAAGAMAADSGYEIGLMSFQAEKPKAEKMGNSGVSYSNSWTVSISEGNYEKTWENASGVFGDSEDAKRFENSNFVYDGTPSIEDFHDSTDSWTRELDAKNKFSSGYKITGKLSINTLAVTADIQYKKGQVFDIEFDTPIPKLVSLAVSSDIAAELDMEGTLSGRLKIGTIPIPLPAPGLAVSVDLYLYTDASGTLQVEASFAHIAKIEWRDGDKLRKVQESDADISTEAALDVDFGADLSASLDAFGFEIIDAGVKAGGNLTASASISGECQETKEDGEKVRKYQEKLSLNADLYTPIITLYLGGEDTLLAKVGISGSWDIVTKENGAKKISLLDREWVFWEDTVMLDENGEPVPSWNGIKLNHTYFTRFGKITDSPELTFAFDYPDGWEITEETVSQTNETVELSNSRGATVKYSLYSGITDDVINGGYTYGSQASMREVEITKAADSSFIPGNIQDTDYSDLGQFAVTEVRTLSVYDYAAGDMRPVESNSVQYAVLPEKSYSDGSMSWLQGLDEAALAFYYGGGVSLIAHTPEGQFTEQEEKEAIAILSSFRVDSNPDTENRLLTYKTKFKEEYHDSNGNGTTAENVCPAFAFDYPENWVVEYESVSGGGGMPGEFVRLSNSRGVEISYAMVGGFLTEFDQYQFSKEYQEDCEVILSKAADSQLLPTKVSTVDLSYLEPFAVEKIEAVSGEGYIGQNAFSDVDRQLEAGEVCYALMSENDSQGKPTNIVDLGFWYGTTLSFIAKSPDGQFTEEEEKEVIGILSSFRLAE